MLVAATGHVRTFAILFAMVALSASVAAGCGSGGGDTVTVKTDTQAAVKAQAERQAPSAAVFVGKIEKTNPGQISRLCLVMKAKGEGAAFVYFKKGYELAFPDEKIPPRKVFDEIVTHCG
jgi:hypothetical protein